MNTKLWNEVFTTDPKAVKPITGKQYQGNSPKPYWIIKRATEVFGPCGISWGVEVVNERFERLTETDVLHVALINVWYEYEGKKGNVQQMGQTKACYLSSKGQMIIDEDAPKKSVTDGMVKCLSMIGFAGDIFSGRWDDSKYIQLAAKETEKRESNAGYDTYESEFLPVLKMAAMSGTDELHKVFKGIQVNEFKAQLWANHSKRLKEAAELADGEKK